MTANIDTAKLREISKELAEIEWVDTDADKTSQRHCPLCFEIEEGHGHADDCQWPAIAATMLNLAEENERLKGLVGQQAGDLVLLTDAFHDAIRRPMGVIPKSGEQFYDQDRE